MRSVTLSSNAEMRSCVSVTRFIENDTRTTSSDPSHAELSTWREMRKTVANVPRSLVWGHVL